MFTKFALAAYLLGGSIKVFKGGISLCCYSDTEACVFQWTLLQDCISEPLFDEARCVVDAVH